MCAWCILKIYHTLKLKWGDSLIQSYQDSQDKRLPSLGYGRRKSPLYWTLKSPYDTLSLIKM